MSQFKFKNCASNEIRYEFINSIYCVEIETNYTNFKKYYIIYNDSC